MPSPASFLQRMFELARWMAHREHRAWRLADDVFSDAADNQMGQSGAAVRAHDDQIGILGLRRRHDFDERAADTQDRASLETANAQPGREAVEFTLRQQAPLFG